MEMSLRTNSLEQARMTAAEVCKRLSKETLCSRQVTILAEKEFDRIANAVDGTVKMHPLGRGP